MKNVDFRSGVKFFEQLILGNQWRKDFILKEILCSSHFTQRNWFKCKYMSSKTGIVCLCDHTSLGKENLKNWSSQIGRSLFTVMGVVFDILDLLAQNKLTSTSKSTLKDWWNWYFFVCGQSPFARLFRLLVGSFRWFDTQGECTRIRRLSDYLWYAAVFVPSWNVILLIDV